MYLLLTFWNKSTFSQSEYFKICGQKRKWHITLSVLATDSFVGQFCRIREQISPFTVVKVWWHISRLRKITLFFSRRSVCASWMSVCPSVSLMFLKRWTGAGDVANNFFFIFLSSLQKKNWYVCLQCLNYDNCFEFCGCNAVRQENTSVYFENNVADF